tara:strand:- start:1519 stop:2343 length:825 start_codon:yes stop_codon:yes gene_type:complete
MLKSIISFIGFNSYLGQKKLASINNPRELINYLKIPLKNFIEINNLSTSLSENLKKLYQQNSSFYGPRINIGGDHSMAIATIADSLQKYPDLKVVWIDAHPDINTRNSSATNNYHGMPLAFLSGLDHDSTFNFIEKKLDLSNLIYLGIRDIDEYEQKIINKHNITYYRVSECEKNVPRVLTELDKVIGDNPIHISFDVDSLDPSVLDSTGTPVIGGLSLNIAQILLDYLAFKNWVNLDITELNLNLGNREKSLNNLKLIINDFLKNNRNIRSHL